MCYLFESLQLTVPYWVHSNKNKSKYKVYRDVSHHEVEDIVAAPDVSMSVSLVVVYDKELSYAEENNDDDDYNDDGDDDSDDDIDDDAEDTKKFATPTSKQGTAASEEIDFDVYYGDLRTLVMANFPLITIDLRKIKEGFAFSFDEDRDTKEQKE